VIEHALMSFGHKISASAHKIKFHQETSTNQTESAISTLNLVVG